MIKAAIIGADTPESGELIRLLINHPEVEVVALIASANEGNPITSVHHGLYGETNLKFSAKLPSAKEMDILFVNIRPKEFPALADLKSANPRLLIVLMQGIDGIPRDMETPVYGLSEINRKPLVRGATVATVPSPIASASLVALYPLALNMLLNPTLRINVKAPEDVVREQTEISKKEIEMMLHDVQRSFESPVNIETSLSDSERAMELEISLDCNIDLEHILKMYDIYDDHRFAFHVSGRLSCADVGGTEKCLFNISKKTPSLLSIRIVADPRMRGASGEAVHIMNLLCALHEKTGLSLKASAYSE